ncbi:MAG TPA: ATP-binding cassette domain-containing protein, partial [Nitrososphaerales archaeon]|nr:ATP-binding cassette domain-containing protein [Nitrososphaerales archaeon]
MPLLDVRGLCIDYKLQNGYLRAVDSVSFQIDEGEVLGLAGESGSGKSTIAHSILKILPRTTRVSGSILVDGTEVVQMDDRAARAYRWKVVSLVPQGSMNAFDPVITI